MGTTELADRLSTIEENYYLRDALQTDSSFDTLEHIIWDNRIELKREEARAVLEHQIDTTGLIIHTENELEGNENDGSN